MNKDMKQLCRSLRKQGWTVERTSKGHYRAITPAGRKIVMPSTPSDGRSVLNTRALLRRAGAVL